MIYQLALPFYRPSKAQAHSQEEITTLGGPPVELPSGAVVIPQAVGSDPGTDRYIPGCCLSHMDKNRVSLQYTPHLK